MINEYYAGEDVIAEDHGGSDFVKISPSQAADFFSSTRQWYGQTLLGEAGFEGSDSTILGTIVHYFAEQLCGQQIFALAVSSSRCIFVFVHHRLHPVK